MHRGISGNANAGRHESMKKHPAQGRIRGWNKEEMNGKRTMLWVDAFTFTRNLDALAVQRPLVVLASRVKFVNNPIL
jgi:hypothetical protein